MVTKAKAILLSTEFINGLTQFIPQFCSGEVVWDNYHASALCGGTLIPVIFKFRAGEKPSTDQAYNVIVSSARGDQARRENRATIDHWELKFYPVGVDEAKNKFYFLSCKFDEEIEFENRKVPENIIRFKGVSMKGVIFSQPIGVEPKYDIQLVTTEVVFDSSVMLRLEGAQTKILRGHKIIEKKDKFLSIVIYDHRKVYDVVAQCCHERKILSNGRVFDYYKLHNFIDDGRGVNHILTADGISAVEETVV
ncbi:MAG: hypothetical protein WC863_00430 [Patescibacteria group bacterium]